MLNEGLISFLNQPFTNITADSRHVTAGGLFLAYPGLVSDGRDYIAQAIANGATGVLWESDEGHQPEFEWHSGWQVKHLAVHGLKNLVSAIAAQYYHAPSKQCCVVGVTGTNGKTTVSQWIAQCLDYIGQRCAVIGTLGNGFVRELSATVNTTPDAILTQRLMHDYVKEGATAIAMEVSSHGLAQGRVNDVVFEIAVLTNLSRDHLDYHKTMEAYADAKRKLFEMHGLKTAVLNIDDALGVSIAQQYIKQEKSMLTYGFNDGLNAAHIKGDDLQFLDAGLAMNVKTPKGSGRLKANVLGEFNAYNLLAVLATLLSLNVDFDDALDVIQYLKPVAGRMQQLGGVDAPLVVVDFAHTPDALEKVLMSLKKQLNKTNKLFCVFGCGGDRDVGKRSLMGNIAQQYADMVMVTSDNPRSESPSVIIEAVTHEMQQPYWTEVDRRKAIEEVLEHANAGDIVLIAGKGHEEYQEIAGVKYPFSDYLVAKTALENRKR